jgi:chloramphenicol-sensitive protein RarD
MSPPVSKQSISGIAYAAAAYLCWGLFPLYFRALSEVPALEVLAHRVVWSVLFLVLLITALRNWPATARALGTGGMIRTLTVTALLLSCNWGVYIWAVNAGYALEASLGYFVNPLLSVALGVIFLGDRLSPRQALAIALASTGVVALVVRAGRVPWIALALALTFGFYGLIRKRIRVDPLAGLLGEVGVLLVPALAYLGWLHGTHAGHFGWSLEPTVLLTLSGIVTAAPLIWFAKGVERLRLSTVGLMQYLNPTLQFLIAVFVFGESFTTAYALAFCCIWLALAIYTLDFLRTARRPFLDRGTG